MSNMDTIDLAVIEPDYKTQGLYYNVLSQANALKERVFPRLGFSSITLDTGAETANLSDIKFATDNPYTIIRRMFNLITWYVIIVLSISWINTYNEYGVCNVVKGSYYKIDVASLGTKGQCLKTQVEKSKTTAQVI